MADETLILDGDMSIDQTNLEDNMVGADSNAGGDDDDFVDDDIPEGADDDPEDDDFKLDGYEDLHIPEQDDQDEADAYDPEYDNNITPRKRKRNRPAYLTKTTTMRLQPDDADPFILNEDNDFLNKQSSRVPGTFGRRNRRKGETLPAYHKRVSHELDSDDELMMEMREKGFSDRQIADKLAKDGRVRYDQKSISTRIMRIRLAQADNVDFLLREGYKEWEFEDDALLMQAFALADIEINYEVERIRAWRFRKVSEYMRRLNKDALFSATACRERYNSITEGTARIPTEQDDDPATRRAELEAYRVSREATRNAEKAAKDAAEALENKMKTESKSRNAQKAEETANKRAAKEAEKAQRAMTRAAQAQIRAQRAQENQNAKAQRNKQIQNQKSSITEAKKRASAAATAAAAVPNKNTTLTLANTKNVTSSTPDPRSFLSLPDLRQMCEDRGLDMPRVLSKESLVQALRDADDEFSQLDLRKMCRSKGLSTAGSKSHMKYQLALAAAKGRDSFEERVGAAEGGAEDDEEMEMEVDVDVDDE